MPTNPQTEQSELSPSKFPEEASGGWEAVSSDLHLADEVVRPGPRRNGRRVLWLLILIALPIVGGVVSFAQLRAQNERIAALASEQADRARALLRVADAARVAARTARMPEATEDHLRTDLAVLIGAAGDPVCDGPVRAAAHDVRTAVLDARAAGHVESGAVDDALARLGGAMESVLAPADGRYELDIEAESRVARDRAGASLGIFTLLGLLAGAFAVRTFVRPTSPTVLNFGPPVEPVPDAAARAEFVAVPRSTLPAPPAPVAPVAEPPTAEAQAAAPAATRQPAPLAAPAPAAKEPAPEREPDTRSASETPLEEMGVAFSRMVENLAASESLVRDKEARLRMILETAADGIVTIDRTGSIESFNAKAKDIFGYREVEVLGKNVALLVSEAWAAENRKYVADYLASGKSGVLGHVRQVTGLRKDGTTVPLEVVISEARVGKRVTFTSIVRDITERKAADEKRSRLIRELESKNAEMERFTYTVSHDLKSPLITIRGFLGLLEKDLMAGHADRVRADLTHIHAAVASMQTLLAELLELSRVGRIVNDPKIVSVHDLVHEALERVIGLVAERGLTVDVTPSNLYVMGDQPRLIEVFQNLIENAAKFCGDDNPSPRLRVDFHAEGDDVVCEFRDNGIGIDPQFRDRVFVLFERLDPSSEGTGIGLALVKRIVELHGGSVWVESAGAGKGSRFSVRLPRKGGDDDVAAL